MTHNEKVLQRHGVQKNGTKGESLLDVLNGIIAQHGSTISITGMTSKAIYEDERCTGVVNMVQFRKGNVR